MHEPPPVKAGDVLDGKFRVERVLGVGGMGVVIAATHLDLNEVRAVKYILPGKGDNSKLVERFLREARAAVKLKSHHVVRVFDVGRFQSGEPYMVMEYLQGSDLQDMLEQRGALPVTVAIDYVLQALDAVAEAHRRGIIHRDLKPANLFLARDEDGHEAVKVLDFGISKLTGELARGQDFDMTKTATMLGSPYYMSPEQMRSTKDVDLRSDLWSLGVICYQLLTGKLPFAGDSITALCATVFMEQPASLVTLRSDLPVGLDAVVMRCLEKDPNRRFQNAGELGAALAAFGDAHASTRLQLVARHSQTTASGAHMVPAQTAGAAATTGQPQPMNHTAASFAQSTAAKPTNAKSNSGAKTMLIALAVIALLALVGGGLMVATGGEESTANSSTPATSNNPTAAASSNAQPPPQTSTEPSASSHVAAFPATSSSASASASASSQAAPSASVPKVVRPRPYRRPKDPFGTSRE